MKKLLLGIAGAGVITFQGCLPPPQGGNPQPQSQSQGTSISLFQKLYPNLSMYMPRKIEGVRPKNLCPSYIKVWVGSYSDKKGDWHSAHWEWLKIGDCKPRTNF